MATRISSAVQNDLAEHLGAKADGGELELWSGSRPSNVDDAPAGDLLASFTLQNPAFGSASSGEITANGLTLETTGNSAAGTGTDVGFVRVVDSGGTGLWDNDNVGTDSNTNTVVLNTLTITEGVSVELTDFSVTQAAQ